MDAFVTKAIDVTGLDGPDCEERLRRSLAPLPGIEDVRLHRGGGGGRVRVRYDPRRVRLSVIETTLSDAGYPPKGGFWANVRRNWRHFTEANELDSLRSTPHCCNKPPSKP